LALVRRLDHVILCGRDRTEWVPRIERVLGLRPRRSREADAWGFSNAEFDIGAGFLGLVEPAGADSQLHRFLARFPEGFYAMSVAVGDLGEAAEFLSSRGVPSRTATRDGQVSLLWVPPSATEGVLYQLTQGSPVQAGTNPEYVGLSSLVVAVEDLDAGVAAYQRCFGLDEATPVSDDRLGYQGVALSVPGAGLGDTIVVAIPSGSGGAGGSGGALAAQLAARGPGIFQFTIAVRDLRAELARLAAAGVATTLDGSPEAPVAAWIDPEALRGVRVELRPVVAE
jgi:catechol 2,3-dioxygenase-like lactoylglutathione lyase family enzyme